MSRKIDIEASKNEDLIRCRSGFHLLLITGLFMFPVQSWAQMDTLEVACDTTVFGHHYTRCITIGTSQPIEFGNRNRKGQRHGRWCELRGDGTDRAVGGYLHDKRMGWWWTSKHLRVLYNRKGETMRMEKDCRGCPAF